MKRILYILVLAMMAIGAHAATQYSYYYQKAEKAYEQKDYETCLRYLEKGVKEDPKDGPCWAVMAEIYSKRDYARYAEALETSEKALKLLKKDKGWCAFLYNIRGDVYYKIDDLVQSEQNYRMAVNINPTVDGYVSLGDVLREQKKYAEAVEVFGRVVDMRPDLIYAYGLLADACLLNGDLNAAERNANLAVYLSDGENIVSHQVLSRLALRRKQVPMACSELAKACFADKNMSVEFDSIYRLYPDLVDAAMLNEYEIRRNDLHANARISVYYCNTQRIMDALYYLHRASDLADNNNYSSHLASLYYLFDQYEKALEYAQEVLKADSTQSDMYAFVSRCYSSLGQHDKAIEYRQRCIRLSDAPSVDYRMIGREYIQLGDYEHAIQYMDSAIMLVNAADMPIAVFNRGEAYRMFGNEQKALADLHEAQMMLDGHPDRGTIYYVHALLGEREPVDQYVDSMTHHLSDKTEYHTLIDLYACLHDKEQTIRYIDFAREHGVRCAQTLREHFRLRWLRDDADFQAAVQRMQQVEIEELQMLNARLRGGEQDKSGTTEIPFTISGGVNQVRCQINGLPLYFVFDTGASDVTISSVEANFMLKNGYLTDADFMGKQNYVTATGEIHEGTIINLREVRVGDITLTNIKASVIANQRAPLLLGQTVFRRFGTLEVDNQQHIIIFRK